MGANEQKKDTPGAGDTGMSMETERAAGEKKKSNILLTIIGVLIFLLAVAAGGIIGYASLPVVVGQHAGDARGLEEKITKRLEVKSVISLEPFTINLADTDDIRFLKAVFQLGMADKVKEEADKNSAEVASIRDSIISLLCSKTSDQIMTPDGKENLREEIRTLINARSPKSRVAEVYIVDFVVQL